MQTPRRAAAAFLVSALLTAPGCSSGNFSADVSGTVTLDGEPIGPGVITFAPVDQKANPSVGAIQQDGAYFLKTKHERGIDAGTYGVSIQVYEPEEKLPPGQRSTQRPEPLVPEKYLTVATSGLTRDVEPGNQTIDFNLVSE